MHRIVLGIWWDLKNLRSIFGEAHTLLDITCHTVPVLKLQMPLGNPRQRIKFMNCIGQTSFIFVLIDGDKGRINLALIGFGSMLEVIGVLIAGSALALHL